MTKVGMKAILAGHLARYRCWSHAQLAGRVERGPFWRPCDCLEHIEGIAPDGTAYQIEINVFWDDRPGEEVRVVASLSAEPQRPLWGFIPIYTPDVTDGFVMAPDGSFPPEDGMNRAGDAQP